MHLCDSAIYYSKAIEAYGRSDKNFEFYWILEDVHNVSADMYMEKKTIYMMIHTI
jgi:hypothetical protein